MEKHRSPEQVASEIQGFIDGLIRFFAPYEYSDGVKTILSQLKAAHVKIVELGELLTNDPENKGIKAELKELTGQTAALTKQITKMVSEIDAKDDSIAEKDKRIKELEKELAQYKDK